YFFIREHIEFLQMDVENFNVGKVWINLRKRHIRNYQKWLAEDAISYQSNEAYKPATISRKLRITRSFLKWLYE
ncbi:integrase, partial [Bacillus sp. AFS018417]